MYSASGHIAVPSPEHGFRTDLLSVHDGPRVRMMVRPDGDRMIRCRDVVRGVKEARGDPVTTQIEWMK